MDNGCGMGIFDDVPMGASWESIADARDEAWENEMKESDKWAPFIYEHDGWYLYQCAIRLSLFWSRRKLHIRACPNCRYRHIDTMMKIGVDEE